MSTSTTRRFHFRPSIKALCITVAMAAALVSGPRILAQSDASGGDSNSHSGEIGDSSDSSTHHNEKIKKCCDCFKPELEILYEDSSGYKNQANKGSDVECYNIPAAANGIVQVWVKVGKKSEVEGCDDAKPEVGIFEKETGKMVSDFIEGEETKHTFKGKDSVSYLVKVRCKNGSLAEAYNCPQACIRIGCGCGDGACDSGLCSVDPLPGSPSISDSLGTSNQGDSSGLKLTYQSDELTNKGSAGLSLWAPNDGSVIVTRDVDGRLTSVRTGNVVATVIATPTEEDPMAFSISKSTNFTSPSQDVFRVTLYESKTVDNRPTFSVSSTYKGKTTSLYYAQPEAGTWELVTGITEDTLQGLIKQRVVTTENGSSRTERTTRIDVLSDVVTADTETTYTTFPWGVCKTRHVDFSGESEMVSSWDYYEPGEITGLHGGTHGYGRLQSYVRYDGYEETHLYDLNRHTIFMPFAGQDGALVETRQYQPHNKTYTVSQNVGGVMISKVETIEESDTLTRTRRYTSLDDYLETVTERFPYGQDFGGQLKKISRPDGTVTIYAYSRDSDSKTTTTREGIGAGDTISEGRKTQRTVNLAGELVSSVSWAVGGSGDGLVLDHQVATDYDLNRPTVFGYFPQDGGGYAYTTSRNYGCCGLVNQTDRYGITTHYAYDALRRVTKVNRLGVTTETQYRGLITHTLRYPESGEVAELGAASPTLDHEVARTVRSMDGQTITWTADANNDGDLEPLTRQVRYRVAPGNIPKSLIPGTDEYEAYIQSHTEASVVTTTYPDATTSQTVTYLDGRTKSTRDQGGYTTYHSYQTHTEGGGGVQSRVTLPGGTQWTDSLVDLAGRTIITRFADLAGVSRSYYRSGATPPAAVGKLASITDPDGLVVTYSYNAKGEATVSKPITEGRISTSTTESSLVNDPDIGAAYQSVSKVNGKVLSTSLRSVDGLKSKSVSLAGTSSSWQTITGAGAWTVSSTTPDMQRTVQTYSGGRLQRSETFDNSETPVSVAFTNYLYDGLGRVVTTTDSRTGATTVSAFTDTDAPLSVVSNGGSDTTSYEYDSMGRRITVTLPNESTTHTSYTARGQVLATWGSQTYARLYQYDGQGRMSELRTYQNLAHGTEPTALTADYASTSWLYDSERGWLVEKNYAGESDNGTADADYSYTLAGRLESRTWERGVTTDYAYDQGVLVEVDYSDSTLDVAYRYDAYGRPETVTQGANSHQYSYDADTLALVRESIAYDTNGDGVADFTRTLDRQQDALLRPAGYDLKNAGTVEHATSYAYDAAGRLQYVHPAADLPADPSSSDFTYGYVDHSYGLVHTVTGPGHTVTNSYEPHRNVLTSKQNSVLSASSVVSHFTYSVNNLGQRTGLTTGGTAFTTAPSYQWGYNPRGELTQADDTSAANNDRAYQYDGIGNRQKTVNGLFGALPDNDNYVANALNQYSMANGVSLPANAYDVDGNLVIAPLPKDPLTHVKYIWDAENRLTEITNLAGTSTIAQYAYDYLGRRISKTVGSASTHYVYDGWNPIAEYAGHSVSKSYTWGMDLSGSMQGAGGVGGLLRVTEHGVSSGSDYYPTYDGNGNVSEYLDASGAPVAHYEYDAFGNTLVSSGSKVADFAHRFSTKLHDAETGLYYYGYRFYDPVTGRWPSRDPIEERGGYNIYGFIGNNAILNTDYLGLVEKVVEMNEEISGSSGVSGNATLSKSVRYVTGRERYRTMTPFGYTYVWRNTYGYKKETKSYSGKGTLNVKFSIYNQFAVDCDTGKVRSANAKPISHGGSASVSTTVDAAAIQFKTQESVTDADIRQLVHNVESEVYDFLDKKYKLITFKVNVFTTVSKMVTTELTAGIKTPGWEVTFGGGGSNTAKVLVKKDNIPFTVICECENGGDWK